MRKPRKIGLFEKILKKVAKKFGGKRNIMYLCSVKQSTNKPNKEDTAMAQMFDIMAEMSARREMVIESYNAATENKFFDGITLKAYMTEVLAIIRNNNPRSVARLEKLLPLAIGEVRVKHTRVDARDKAVEAIRRSGNQQALALV